MKTEISMPADWDDHEGWEQFYTAMAAKVGKTNWVDDGFERFMLFQNDPARFVADLQAKGWSKVWLPGCGMSPIPKMLAELGLDIHATDISPTAVAFQRARYKDGLPIIASINSEQQAGPFESKVQDARSPYLENYFDLVINVKAFSGFTRETMGKVAESHFRALRPGRQALFVTLNVQDEAMEAMEDSLLKTGFILPSWEASHWYRQKLREAGIPSNATPAWFMGRNNSDEKKYKYYISILKEHLARTKAVGEAEYKHIQSGEKLAKIFQLTG